jgi:hypothetical protein
MEDSQEKKRDLKILEKTRELRLICDGWIKEFNEASTPEGEAWKTKGAARRFWHKIQDGHRDVTKILRELEVLMTEEELRKIQEELNEMTKIKRQLEKLLNTTLGLP